MCSNRLQIPHVRCLWACERSAYIINRQHPWDQNFIDKQIFSSCKTHHDNAPLASTFVAGRPPKLVFTCVTFTSPQIPLAICTCVCVCLCLFVHVQNERRAENSCWSGGARYHLRVYSSFPHPIPKQLPVAMELVRGPDILILCGLARNSTAYSLTVLLSSFFYFYFAPGPGMNGDGGDTLCFVCAIKHTHTHTHTQGRALAC